jgi:hypothetical protein
MDVVTTTWFERYCSANNAGKRSQLENIPVGVAGFMAL